MKKTVLAFFLIPQLQNTAQIAPVCFKTLTTTPSVGRHPESVRFSDFNANGKADLAVANLNSNNISVWIGNGIDSSIVLQKLNAGKSELNLSIQESGLYYM